MTNFSIQTSVVIPKQYETHFKEQVTAFAKSFSIDCDVDTSETVEMTNAKVTLSVSAPKAIKQILKVTGVPEEELKVLSKVKSVCENAISFLFQKFIQQQQQNQQQR